MNKEGKRRILLIRKSPQRKKKSITCTALISAADLLCTGLIRRMFIQFWSEYLTLCANMTAPF